MLGRCGLQPWGCNHGAAPAEGKGPAKATTKAEGKGPAKAPTKTEGKGKAKAEEHSPEVKEEMPMKDSCERAHEGQHSPEYDALKEEPSLEVLAADLQQAEEEAEEQAQKLLHLAYGATEQEAEEFRMQEQRLRLAAALSGAANLELLRPHETTIVKDYVEHETFGQAVFSDQRLLVEELLNQWKELIEFSKLETDDARCAAELQYSDWTVIMLPEGQATNSKLLFCIFAQTIFKTIPIHGCANMFWSGRLMNSGYLLLSMCLNLPVTFGSSDHMYGALIIARLLLCRKVD